MLGALVNEQGTFNELAIVKAGEDAFAPLSMPNWKFLEYSKRTPFRPSLGRGRPFPIARLENYNLKEANLVLRRFEDFRSRTPNAKCFTIAGRRAAHHPC